ncbi:MAG: MBL fold metallo-hydrolase [Undibacterium sp.]|nr:MBL fold metallo-hydrolase [Undibacterium sp.]
MQLSFHGANRNVTGSCHLIECQGKKILIDCGLFQGGRELAEENQADFGFDAREIDFVLLTHAHLDHCGRLPLLVKRGFRGEIITTAATKDLARLVLLDSAHIQESEAKFQNKRQARRGETATSQALYSLYDASHCLDFFGREAKYQQAIQLATGITATFYDAGHILGSSSIFLKLEEKNQQTDALTVKHIVFSGDIGSDGRKFIRDAVAPPQADIVVMESTYGDRLHRSLEDSVSELYQAIRSSFAQGGNVIIPTFALERAQEILWYLKEGLEQGQLPKSMHVFLDSPMAISATEIFRQHPECFDVETQTLFSQHKDPLQVPNLHFTRDAIDSMAINRIHSGAVIMAGSGMCTGGRVRHHLKHHLWRKDSSIVFVGFAANTTLARKIIDGAKHVYLMGEEISVKAKIYTINGFSAHADRDELLAWHAKIRPSETFLVHGEAEVMQTFAQHLKDTTVHLPQQGDVITLS